MTQKEGGICHTRYPSSPIIDFEVEIILLKTPLDFLNFIDLQPRYHTSSIGHPFNFKTPVITVFCEVQQVLENKFFARVHARPCTRTGVCVCALQIVFFMCACQDQSYDRLK